MGEEVCDRLQQTLRSLCYKTRWKYAVFWKLKRRARMMLTWEDAYYDKDEPYDSSKNMVAKMCSTKADLHGSHYMGDPLGLAVAKMSYLVYSLGEGIIGKVAFTGKHRWIFANKPASPWSSTEYLDGWQTQFSAGIKTVAVVAVVPHGVVQLGSLDVVVEDLELVSHIKGIFGLLQSSSAAFPPDSNLANILPQVRNILNLSAVSTSCSHGLDQAVIYKKPSLQPHLSMFLGKYGDLSNDTLPLRGFHQSEIIPVVGESLMFGGDYVEFAGLGSRSPSEFQKQIQPISQDLGVKNSNYFMETCKAAICSVGPSYSVHSENMKLNGGGKLVDACKVDNFSLPLVTDLAHQDRIRPSTIVSHRDEEQQLPEPLGMQLRNDREGKRFQVNENHTDNMNYPLKFFAGSELHEALGSSLQKEQETCVWSEAGSAEFEGLVESPDGVLSSLFSRSEDLLEAVVANACCAASNVEPENSLCKSSHSILTTEPVLHSLNHVKNGSSARSQLQSSTFLANEDIYQNMSSIGGSSELFTARCPNEALSKTQGTCSELSDRSGGPAKNSRKRSRPGESCRPRPRDRQLIQDRIKELREIVPNGSKCSIDTLLERTIKHMLFLQSVSSHADKLKKCVESKSCDRVSRLLGTCSHEHHATWALEVGVNSNACPIIVENLNVNGQMLVEMLYEECGSFLKIAEVIRGLGLTILKGVTESRAEKTWACFVVEGQENGQLQRMDILWSLMQLLQPETKV